MIGESAMLVKGESAGKKKNLNGLVSTVCHLQKGIKCCYMF